MKAATSTRAAESGGTPTCSPDVPRTPLFVTGERHLGAGPRRASPPSSTGRRLRRRAGVVAASSAAADRSTACRPASPRCCRMRKLVYLVRGAGRRHALAVADAGLRGPRAPVARRDVASRAGLRPGARAGGLDQLGGVNPESPSPGWGLVLRTEVLHAPVGAGALRRCASSSASIPPTAPVGAGGAGQRCQRAHDRPAPRRRRRWPACRRRRRRPAVLPRAGAQRTAGGRRMAVPASRRRPSLPPPGAARRPDDGPAVGALVAAHASTSGTGLDS